MLSLLPTGTGTVPVLRQRHDGRAPERADILYYSVYFKETKYILLVDSRTATKASLGPGLNLTPVWIVPHCAIAETEQF